VQKGKKFVTFALIYTYGTTMDLHKEGVYRDGNFEIAVAKLKETL
jgi:hypothetical protein